jgi:asparagine synthase (glutamine-hydrolysing)
MRAMCDAQIHRGPDDEGYYAKGPISLGIRRLAIIDLTKGLYPLTNEDGTIQLVFNGEIYDFNKLRIDLEAHGHRFHTNTDAETLVHAYEEWDTDCLARLNGMFAFGLWDEHKHVLFIARDNFGIKPLYYHQGKNFFAFASEIKPLLTHPNIPVVPNEHVIREYLRASLVDTLEETFFEGISHLPPAHFLLVSEDGSVKRERYWKPDISSALDGPISEQEIERTRLLFLEAVRRQLVSDVPVGTCLSGGIDSSSVVCAIRKVHPEGAVSTGKRVKTFSASFPGYSIDETDYARAVCDATDAEHNTVTPTALEFWADLPTLVRCQEEPFVSTSIYAQWRVMKYAKEHGITVLLDGQGGDELLCGYVPYYLNYYLTLRRKGKYLKLVVEAFRSKDLTGSYVIGHLRKMALRTVHRYYSYIRKSGKTAVEFPHESDQSVAPTLRPRVDDLAAILEDHTTNTSLPALLRYEDKNSMWHSIEARVPFLDLFFFEYVAALPIDRKLRGGWTKYIFRAAMRSVLPEKIRLRRSKVGFETPEKRWIGHDLRERLREFFSGTDLYIEKLYDVAAVRALLNAPSLTQEQISLIWRTLNLELWYREFFRAHSTHKT